MTNHTKLVREGRNEKLEEEEGGDAILNRSPIHHQEVTRTCSSRSYFSSFFFVYQLFSQVFFTTGMSDDQPFDNDRTEKGLRKKEEPGVVSLYTLTGIVQILALED